jgi:hypothetical protein
VYGLALLLHEQADAQSLQTICVDYLIQPKNIARVNLRFHFYDGVEIVWIFSYRIRDRIRLEGESI